MEILESALAGDINKIIDKTTQARYYWTADIHNPNEKVSVLKVISIDAKCDYEENFTDEIVIKVLVPGGQYAYKLFPYLDNLELTLYKFDAYSNNYEQLDGAKSISNERYVATIINPPASSVEMNTRIKPTEAALDISSFVELKIQLINKAVDQMRMRTFGNNFRNNTGHEVVRSVLTSESRLIDVSSEYLPQGVDIIPIKNPVKRDHIIIPQGTRLVDVPDYVHRHCGGVYSTGMSYYYYKGLWYVFPSYDTTRFDTTAKTMSIINVPAKNMPGMEKTFIVEGNHTTIIATGNTKVFNASEELILNKGNGVRFANADGFMESFAETADNKALASRGRTNNEFITIKRGNGNNNVMQSPNKITANSLFEYSKLAARDGVMMMLSWENSNPDIIYPGMPVRLKYLEDDDIKEVDGVVLKTHNYIQLAGDGLLTNRHLCTTSIALFIKRTIFKNN